MNDDELQAARTLIELAREYVGQTEAMNEPFRSQTTSKRNEARLAADVLERYLDGGETYEQRKIQQGKLEGALRRESRPQIDC